MRNIAAVMLVAGSLLGARGAAQELPGGAGGDVLKARCVSCHGTDLIVSQRLTAAGWAREVDKMVRWGARVDAAEREVLESYLANHFGPKPAASHDTALMPGEAVYTRACLGCHNGGLVEQQRLTRAGWVREVEKMMRWGAKVDAAEKDALVDFLALRPAAR